MMRRARTISLLPMAEAATPGSKPAITKRDPDVPPRQERVRFEILSGRTKVNDQVPFVRACAVQKWIFVVQRLSREIHLRDQAVSLAGDLEMNMRWPYQVRARGIGAWLDRVDDLSRCARGLAGDGGRIRIVIQRLDTSGSSILASPHSSVVTAAVGVPAMNDRFILASIHARDCADADWRCPWLRINLLVREMVNAFRVREARPILKPELTSAIAMREQLKRAPWWN
jgi:hypothetical protein